jgi:hypothetical protein
MSEVTFAQLRDAGCRRACMVEKTVIRFVLLGLSFAVTACSGSDGGSSASVLESCAGSYICVIGGDPVESDLVKSGGSCYLGSLELRADGTSPSISGDPTTWSGDASKLYIRLPAEQCTRRRAVFERELHGDGRELQLGRGQQLLRSGRLLL